MFRIFKRRRKLEAPAPAPIQAPTFGPWATHAPSCKCQHCR